MCSVFYGSRTSVDYRFYFQYVFSSEHEHKQHRFFFKHRMYIHTYCIQYYVMMFVLREVCTHDAYEANRNDDRYSPPMRLEEASLPDLSWSRSAASIFT